MRLQALTAITAGTRGISFASRSPLDAGDPATRYRAAALELLNLELSVVEPWAAAGAFAADATSSDPEVQVTALATERSRLLTVLRLAPGGQFVSGPLGPEAVRLVVPGVPPSYGAYRITPAGLLPLRSPRTTGGTQVTLEDFSVGALIVLTEDPLVINQITRRLAAQQHQAAQCTIEVAQQTFADVDAVHRSIGSQSRVAPHVSSYVGQSRAELRRAAGLFHGKDYEASQQAAEQSLRLLEMAQRTYWREAPSLFASPVTNPYRAAFGTLPLSWSLADRAKSSQPGGNLLGGGDFEHLDYMLRTGWRHWRHHDRDIETEVSLSSDDVHSGRYALRLRASAIDPKSAPQVIESPPVWIGSAATPVQRGQWIQIQGWVRIPRPIQGSREGVLIYDSLAGQTLAARLRTTAGWQQFVMYRAAEKDGDITLTFALAGLGEALFDDVTVTPLEIRQAPPAAPQDQARRLQSIFGLPR